MTSYIVNMIHHGFSQESLVARQLAILYEAIAEVGELAVTRQKFQEIGSEVTRDGREPR
jgi:hypothetical protein